MWLVEFVLIIWVLSVILSGVGVICSGSDGRNVSSLLSTDRGRQLDGMTDGNTGDHRT